MNFPFGMTAMIHNDSNREQTGTYVRTERDFLSSAFQSTTVLLITLDRFGCVVAMNAAAEKAAGIAFSAIQGKPYWDLFFEDSSMERKQWFLEAVERNELPPSNESAWNNSDNETRFIVWSNHALYDARGKIEYIVGTGIDVTTQRQAEAALHKSEERFRLLVQNSSDIITVFSSRGHIEYESPSAQRILGYAPDERKGEPVFNYIHPDDISITRRFFLNAMRQRTSIAEPIEFRYLHADGHWLYLEANGSALMENDKPHGVIVTSRDVSERKRMTEALQESEERNRTIIASLSEGIVLLNTKAEIITLNKSACEILNFPEGNCIGRSASDPSWKMVDQEGKPLDGNDHPVLTTLRTGTCTKDVVIGIQQSSMAIKWLSINTEPLVNEAEQMYAVVASFSDVTEKRRVHDEIVKAKEAAESATKAKANFLATMSHEIRTPMNGVIGMTGLLLETELDDEQREFVETIRVSGDALLTIINDILDFSKIESGKLELEVKPFELRTCIEESFDVFAAKAMEKGLDLLYRVEPDVPAFVSGDVTRLRQVLVNLVGNAIKFTPKGEVFVSVTKKTSLGDDVELQIEVQDTGIGIPADKMDRLFKSFSQVDSSTTREYGGTGLGLAISSRLIEMMNGTIWVTSETGKGSTFAFTIQLGSAPSIPKVYLKSKIPELMYKHVLIVDDNRTNRQILTLQCQQWGMIPTEAQHGYEALAQLEQGHEFDIAMIDMHMPGMDGFELGAHIRQKRTLEQLPMIMLSSGIKNAAEDENHLFSAFVTKPIKQSQLFEIIMQVLTGINQKFLRTPIRQQLDRDLASNIPVSILVAEDNQINQRLILRILKQMGYESDLVQNGVEVLTALGKRTYDIIFMDVQMPMMDGFETTRQVRNLNHGMKQPTIIAMTANAMEGDREKCIDSGMDDYLAKPVRINELQQIIETWGTARNTKAVPTKTQQPNGYLDWDKIDELKMLDEPGQESLLSELVELFENLSPTEIQAVQNAYEQHDCLEVQKESHKLRGAALNIGAKAFAERCEEIENDAREGNLGNLNEKIATLSTLYTNTVNAFRQMHYAIG